MRNVYTVSQVNQYVKSLFTRDFMLNRIYVKGEVSNCKYHTSGHIYFSLKDESGTIACVMFAGSRSGLSFRMRDGQTVIVLGSISIYERDGKYQLYAKEIILDGAGLLYERYEELKRELEEMGMFAPEYKKPIPAFVKRIGIVTAPTGAAVRDIINISHRRNPYVQLILYPALVQGDGAAQSIVRGIRLMQEQDVDVIIVGRGGGSIEDLWAFNEEIVARAIFDSRVPVISAVGHETDTMISDYVADLRAPTPSAAAELAVYEYAACDAMLREYKALLIRQMMQRIKESRATLEQLSLRLKYSHPRQKLLEERQFTDELECRLRRGMKRKMEESRHRLAIYIERMKGLSPLAKLNQGYAYVEDSEGKTLRFVSQAEPGDRIRIYVRDGRILAEVREVCREEYDGSCSENGT
ncbi:MAG: exodeoxyribonuclease VII large subunit [Schaedlerella sp.]|nr:exodeoxyribonuclease VII large subunit [Lachnospiraceae bacterium]MDY4201629.1 exodeoxyribonuclease VII large subunit [Schaedlerella sp.]